MTTHDERTRRFIPLSCILTLASTHKPFDKFEDLLPQNDHQNYKYTLKTSKRVELQNICLQHLFSITRQESLDLVIDASQFAEN